MEISSTKHTDKASSTSFKIDVIVWKCILQGAVSVLGGGFKIDVIVWKLCRGVSPEGVWGVTL